MTRSGERTDRCRRRRAALQAVVGLAAMLAAAAVAVAAPPADPAEFFEPDLGTDGRLAPWSRIADYYRALGATSDRVEVRELGESTLGRSFLLVTISSPANLARADRLREISRRLADPGDDPLAAAEIDALAEEGVAVVAVSLGLHATEVAATQMGPELAYRLATARDPDTERILDNVVFLLFPCFNPDGEEMVAAWNEKMRGTRWEGARYPDLYHHYAGHDNNRDGYFFNLAESRLLSRVLYHEWFPQAYLDVHQMGSYGARLYIPPYLDPIHPNVDPMLWQEHLFVGGSMAVALEEAGITGVESGAPYYGWWMPSFHMITNYHNIAGMLTESASCRLASPLLVHRHQLQGGGRGRPFYGPQRFFAHPWEGGWWRLRDLMEQQRVSTVALLDNAARHRRQWLRRMALKAARNIERGRTESPAAFVVPAAQHDPGSVVLLIGKLMFAGVKVDRAGADFTAGDRAFRGGDYVIGLAQPLRAYVKSLLERIDYPDNPWTREPDGTPMRPYDLTAFTVAEHMGVEAVAVDGLPAVPLERLAEAPVLAGGTRWDGDGDPAGWLVSPAANAAVRVVAGLLRSGGEAFWLRRPTETAGRVWAPGTVWVPASDAGSGLLDRLAGKAGVEAVGVAASPGGPAYRLKPVRLALYRPWQGGNADEGWTRYVLDDFGLPYRRLDARAIRGGGLEEGTDVLVVADDSLESLLGVEPPEDEGAEPEEFPEAFMPPEYLQGLGGDGVDRIRAFVRGGGTLVLLDSAGELATARLGVPVRDAVAGLDRSTFYCPGSTVWMDWDTSHPVAYGMPRRALGVFWNSPAWAVERTPLADRTRVVATYPDDGILGSGWLVGGEHLAGKAAAVEVEYGAGRVLLLGFRPQLRAQTHGTFKVLLNAVLYGAATATTLP